MTERWIVIPRWDGPDGFQHYRDRDPVWIKNHRTLLHSDEYRRLTFVQRGILHGIWLEYAASNRQLRDSTLALTRALGQRVTRASLEALSDAGFIHFSASKPLARRYHDASPHALAREREEKKDPLPLREGDIPLDETGPTLREAGLNPRALGTNPRAVAARERDADREAQHDALLAAADAYVATWRGGDSLVFDDTLDGLERETRSTLTRREREEFWERALDQARNGSRA